MCGVQLDSGGLTAHSQRMASSRTHPLHPSHLSPSARSARARWLAGAACVAIAGGCGTNTGGQTGDENTGNSSDAIEELTGTAQRLAASGDLPNSASSDGWDFG